MKTGIERWKKIRMKGKWNYIFVHGMLLYGLFMAILFSIFFSLAESASFLEFLPLSLVLFLVGGFIVGAIEWYWYENWYKKELNRLSHESEQVMPEK